MLDRRGFLRILGAAPIAAPAALALPAPISSCAAVTPIVADIQADSIVLAMREGLLTIADARAWSGLAHECRTDPTLRAQLLGDFRHVSWSDLHPGARP